jgi:hypothetical protein
MGRIGQAKHKWRLEILTSPQGAGYWANEAGAQRQRLMLAHFWPGNAPETTAD